MWAEAVRRPVRWPGHSYRKGYRSPTMPSRGRQRWHVRPARRAGFSIPDPRTSPHGFVEPDQASGGQGCAVPRPDGDRDCGVQPIGVDEVGQLTDCHGGRNSASRYDSRRSQPGHPRISWPLRGPRRAKLHREARELVSWNDPSGVAAHNAAARRDRRWRRSGRGYVRRSQGSPGMPPRQRCPPPWVVQAP